MRVAMVEEKCLSALRVAARCVEAYGQPSNHAFSDYFHKNCGSRRLFTFLKSEYSSGQREKCGEEYG